MITVSFPFNKDTASLFYLASYFGIDTETLLFLYQRLGTDVFYFFYMLSSKRVTFPRMAAFSAAKNVGAKMYSDICLNSDSNYETFREVETFKKMRESYDRKTNSFLFHYKVEGTVARKVRQGSDKGNIPCEKTNITITKLQEDQLEFGF